MAQQPSRDAHTLEALVAPTFATRWAHQFFTHSGHAPLTLLILEGLLAGSGYFGEPDGYVLIATALVQAAFLVHVDPHRSPALIFLGNLTGVGVYTAIESLLEGGAVFFSASQHVAYWGIAAVFATLQGIRAANDGSPRLTTALLLVENVARSVIPVLLYALFESRADKVPLQATTFFADAAHVYLTVVVLLLGALLAAADVTLRRTQDALRALMRRLHELSSWGFGSQVVAAALTDASRVALSRRDRVLLFMDIRGFTAWSETQTPEAVVAMLNEYYLAAEHCLAPFLPIKIKFTADEVMAVFDDSATALNAARRLQRAAVGCLRPHGLSAGLGLHGGPVVEGLLGSREVKAYDCIGDAVNTASRLCAAAGADELLVSESLLPADAFAELPRRAIDAKGKRSALGVRVIAVDHAPAAG